MISIKPDDIENALIDISDHGALPEKSDGGKILVFRDVGWNAHFHSEPRDFFATRPMAISLHNF